MQVPTCAAASCLAVEEHWMPTETIQGLEGMFDPSWEEGCKSCSHFMDNFAGSIAHLAARDSAFVVVSWAPLEKIEQFKK